MGQGFEIGAKRFQIGAEITNGGKRDFKSGQGLQIGAEQPQVKIWKFNYAAIIWLQLNTYKKAW